MQLYLRDDRLCSVVRPERELKGFRRVHLEPGATQTVRLSLGPDQLCCYGADERWVVEPGTFTVDKTLGNGGRQLHRPAADRHLGGHTRYLTLAAWQRPLIPPRNQRVHSYSQFDDECHGYSACTATISRPDHDGARPSNPIDLTGIAPTLARFAVTSRRRTVDTGDPFTLRFR